MNKEQTSRTRLGVIGVGNSALYGHIPALRTLSEYYEMVAVSSRQASRASAIAHQFRIGLAFGDYRRMIQQPDIDLVVVLPPAPEHAAPVRMAIEAGKHVYCEWPLTTSLHDSADLLSLANQAHIRHAGGLQRRMGASARFVRDLIAQ